VSRWIAACQTTDVDLEDVIPVDVDGQQLAIYRSPDDEFFATDGYCTHEKFLLADGLVSGCIIECPKHNGRFDYTTGEGKRAPIRTKLQTFATQIENGVVFVDLDGTV
jgi:3-phenylpropionate/trans-cinnamate dioxygenase ferredoxin component